jgi:hypothetical protein
MRRKDVVRSIVPVIIAAGALIHGGCDGSSIQIKIEPVALNLRPVYVTNHGPWIVASSVGTAAAPNGYGIFPAIAIDVAYRARFDDLIQKIEQPEGDRRVMVIMDAPMPSMFEPLQPGH